MNPRKTIAQRFAEFDAANPEVRLMLCKFARQLKAKGHNQGSVKMLFEILRWSHMLGELVDTPSTEGFYLSNDYTSHYSRLIMKTEPDLNGFFKTKSLQSY